MIAPLRSITGQPALQSAISAYQSASAKQQSAWTTAYNNALGKATVGPGDSVSLHLNADILVMTVMGVLSLLFVLIPFIPIVNRIPRWITIYRLIWREHYRTAR